MGFPTHIAAIPSKFAKNFKCYTITSVGEVFPPAAPTDDHLCFENIQSFQIINTTPLFIAIGDTYADAVSNTSSDDTRGYFLPGVWSFCMWNEASYLVCRSEEDNGKITVIQSLAYSPDENSFRPWDSGQV